MALLYKYDIAPVRLKDEDMKKYLRYFIENGSYIDEIFDGQYDNMSNLAIWKTNFMDGCLPDEKIFTSRKACKNITGKANLYMERYIRMFLNRLLFYQRLNLK